VDAERGTLRAGGSSARVVLLCDPVRATLMPFAPPDGSDGLVLAGTAGAALEVADIEGYVACAARDAGLARPEEIGADSLRHTLIAYLARQGVRLGDLDTLVGWIAPAAFTEYARLSPPGAGIALAEIDPVMPALRALH